ncbi:hypothetical protein J2X53_003955 [Pseudorhodobacter sp. 4114]|nr:hypothetical protein [Pseudorhodobacter sp. 4114]
MHEARAGIGAEAEEAHGAGGFSKGHGIMVRHGDVEGGAQHVLGGRGPADSAVLAGTTIAGADDQRLAETVAQGLQLVHRFGVDFDRPGAAAGDLGRGKAGPTPSAFGHLAEMGIGRGRHDGLQKCKTRLGGGWGTGSVVGGLFSRCGRAGRPRTSHPAWRGCRSERNRPRVRGSGAARWGVSRSGGGVGSRRRARMLMTTGAEWTP